MHWHTANETHTVIRGTWVFEHEGTRDQLGPGGFNYMPAKMHHQAWGSDDALVFITVDSAWDINWVSGPPPAIVQQSVRDLRLRTRVAQGVAPRADDVHRDGLSSLR
jgi:AraC-like ligand binding domain